MSNVQVEFTMEELLANHPYEAPNIVGGVRCHGGFDSDGRYVSPRTFHRVPAIGAWQAQVVEQFGRPVLDIPLSRWPEHYPNVPQAKFLIRNGIREPIISTLTRVGTIEGFGGGIRYSAIEDMQTHFDEDIRGTAMAHLDKGLFEAHARDEAGYEEEGGHEQMWFAARDLAFENPVSEASVQDILKRMGMGGGGGGGVAGVPARAYPDIDEQLENTLGRMIRLLLIEISAYHTFAWAEEVLADKEIVAGEGRAADIVSYIRSDEAPHVEYLKTVLSEMRERTFVGENRKHKGMDIIMPMWERAVADSLGARREGNLQMNLNEVIHALRDHPKRKDLLEEFHSLGSIRPTVDGKWKATAEDNAY